MSSPSGSSHTWCCRPGNRRYFVSSEGQYRGSTQLEACPAVSPLKKRAPRPEATHSFTQASVAAVVWVPQQGICRAGGAHAAAPAALRKEKGVGPGSPGCTTHCE